MDVKKAAQIITHGWYRVFVACVYEGYEVRQMKAALEFLLEEVNKK